MLVACRPNAGSKDDACEGPSILNACQLDQVHWCKSRLLSRLSEMQSSTEGGCIYMVVVFSSGAIFGSAIMGPVSSNQRVHSGPC